VDKVPGPIVFILQMPKNCEKAIRNVSMWGYPLPPSPGSWPNRSISRTFLHVCILVAVSINQIHGVFICLFRVRSVWCMLSMISALPMGYRPSPVNGCFAPIFLFIDLQQKKKSCLPWGYENFLMYFIWKLIILYKTIKFMSCFEWISVYGVK
jgi:hypothetical protein